MNHRELSFMEIFRIVQHRFLWIILSVILCGAMAYTLSSYIVTPKYTASASLYVYSNSNRTQITSIDLNASQELVNTYIVVLKSDTVLDQVIGELNLDMTPEQVRGILNAGAIDGTEAFDISITHNDPYTAQRIVNTIVDIAPREIIRVVQAGGAEVIDYAKLPDEPSTPNLVLNTVIGALLGLILSSGISIISVAFNTKVHCEDDLKQTFAIAVLGSVPVLEG